MTSRESRLSRRALLKAAAIVVSSATFAWGAPGTAPAIVAAAVWEKRIQFKLTGSGKHRLMAFPIYASTADASAGVVAWEGELGDAATVVVDRFADKSDRLFQKFQLFDAATGKAAGAPHFVDDLRGLPSSPPALPWPSTIKGVSCPIDSADLMELGVRHTHTNLSAAALLRVDEAKREEACSRVVDGERIWLNPAQVRALDHSIRGLTDAKINVVGVVINYIQKPGPLVHPKSDLQHAPHKMGAFNLTNADGLRHFRGLMEFLSDRYCRGNAEFGSVGGWIIGNEVQSHWEWHNMGPATLDEVARQYADELRIAWHAVRNAGAAVPVFASLDHFWATSASKDVLRHRPGRMLVDALGQLSNREGNFPWHLAQHPYPESLFHPQFWNDKTATFGFDSPRITFKNVEVLAGYLRRKDLLVGGQPRRLIFSEQGLHAGDTPESEQIQAAAYALAYERMRQIPGVDAFILHRHVDAAAEGGLKLGIWPLTGIGAGKRRRPIWEVVKAADTAQWAAACRFALPIVGLTDWSQAKPQAGPFPERAPAK